MLEPEIPNQTRLIAKILRELLASESFDDLSDLADALKTRCGRLKIKSTPDDISNAFRLIASNRDLLAGGHQAVPEFEAAPPRDLQPAEAKTIYAQIMAKYQAEHPKPAALEHADRPPDFPDLMVVR